MLRKVILQLALVNGKGIGNMTLANDAAPSSTQGEMDPSSLLRLCVADLPTLFSGKDQLQPRVFHYKQHLRGTPQGTPLTSLFVPSSGVAAVAKDSTTTTIHLPVQICLFLLVSGSGVAAIHLPLQICRRRILLEAHNTEFCSRRSGIVPATRHATFLCHVCVARQA